MIKDKILWLVWNVNFSMLCIDPLTLSSQGIFSIGLQSILST